MSDILIFRQALEEELEIIKDLRWKILKEPFNQPKDIKDDKSDKELLDFVVILDDIIIATGALDIRSEKEGFLREIVVAENYRHQRTGSKLIKYMEWYAERKGCEQLKLNAIDPSIKFFKSLDYKIKSDGPLLYGKIPQKVMQKKIKR